MQPPPTLTGPHDLVVLDDVECRTLLRTRYVGRIGLSISALPVVMPVNYVLDGDRIVLCSEPGAKLDAARRGLVACLEIDDVDVLGHAGWSVLVTGRLSEVTDPADLRHVMELPLQPWVPLVEPHVLSLSVELLTGRRLDHGHRPGHGRR